MQTALYFILHTAQKISPPRQIGSSVSKWLIASSLIFRSAGASSGCSALTFVIPETNLLFLQ